LYPGGDAQLQTSLPGQRLYVESRESCLTQAKHHSDHHQLTLILDVLGTPTMEDYYGIKSRRAREYIRSLPFKKKIPLKVMFPKTSDLALDLLEKLLAFNPVKRITVEEALRHPYLEPYHDPDDEPTAEPIPEEFFNFDKDKDSLSKEQLKSMFFPSPKTLRPNLLTKNPQHSFLRRSCDRSA
jgi:serine/threonine protein kinase